MQSCQQEEMSSQEQKEKKKNLIVVCLIVVVLHPSGEVLIIIKELNDNDDVFHYGLCFERGFIYSLGRVRRVPDEWYDSEASTEEDTDTEEDEPGLAAGGDISEEQRFAGAVCVVRSVLVSTRNVLTVAEFRREYTELVWGELPHLEFGFTSLIQFLYVLRDVCYLVREGGNSEENLWIFPILRSRDEYIRRQLFPDEPENV
ncbi:hypothetical protein ABEB36_000104 [Hypothenemus hampei]|uniref:Uncharacterized protein n=1 Tax=Hypothenemus hampei TaxID=57062 RepID=A0ABD1FB00_HYPHA